jgi:hypothetical protein
VLEFFVILYFIFLQSTMVHMYTKVNQVSMFRFFMQEGSVNKFQCYWNEVCISLIILFEKLLFIFVVQFVFT